MQALLHRFTNVYMLWLVVFAIAGYLKPDLLRWFSGPWILAALTTVMLGMGITLTVADFRRLLKMPGCVALGFTAQYTIMPLAGWGIAHLLKLDAGFAVGLILVASCPGGTASNMITYLARANVALSVVLTLASTLLAFILTPLWCKTLAGTYVPVDAWGLCKTTLQAVVVPVVVGVLLNWRFPTSVAKVAWLGPVVSVVAICFITGGVVASKADVLANHAGLMILAVLMLHVLGFALGYIAPRIFGYSEDVARTVSIEVGMQNGGMAATLATTHFPTQPLAALPAIFSAVTQNLLGSVFASWWRSRPVPAPANRVETDLSAQQQAEETSP